MINSGYVEVNNGQIYYELFGKGETIIFLHGNSQNLHYFDFQIEYFKNNYQILAIDSRGHGKSSKEKKGLNFSIMAEDIMEVMDKVGIKKAHVIGFSDGGNISLELAINYPNRFISMIIIGANLYPKGMKWSVRACIRIQHILLSLKSKFDSSIINECNVIGLMVYEPHFTHSQIKNIKIPLYVIAGEKDIIKKNHTILISKLAQNAKLTILSNATHFIPSENAKELNTLSNDFLAITNNYILKR